MQYAALNKEIFVVSEVLEVKEIGKTTNPGQLIKVSALDTSNGIARWQNEIVLKEKSEQFYLATSEKNLIIVSGKGEIIVLKISDGTISRRTFTGTNLSSNPVFNADRLSFGTAEKRIVSLENTTFTKIYDVESDETAAVLASDEAGNFLWGDARGFVYHADRRGRKGWKFRSGGGIVGIIENEMGWLIISQDNYLYLLSKAGKLHWKKRLAERLSYQPTISGRYIVLATDTDSEVLIVDLLSGRTVNKISFRTNVFLRASPFIFGEMIVLLTNEGFTGYTTSLCAARANN